MQLELNLIFIGFKHAYLLWYLELTARQVFRGHHYDLFPKKKIKIKIKFPNEEWVKDLRENYPK
jgi:hypothetical protein